MKLITWFATLFFALTALSADSTFLKRFQDNPKAAYLELPQKDGNKSAIFQMTDILTENYQEAKNDFRDRVCDEECQAKMVNKASDGFENGLVDFFADSELGAWTNIFHMENQQLTKGRVAVQPWAGSYWPLYKGGLAFRYSNSRARDDFDRNERRRRFPPRTHRERHINRLSPAGKYDYLMGDEEFNLVDRMWRRGRWYYDNNEHNRVLPWMGYCHGWAIAAIAEPRPRKSITVRGPEGKNVTFNPTDIKGLASVLWGNLEFEMHYQGSRCFTRRPSTDANGRITDPKCWDINPGLFHTVLVNKIGVEKKSFVFDSHYDFEVWNHPLRGYSYTYFNPQTKEEVADINLATVKKEEFTNDPFAAYRSEDAVQYVGIKLKVEYINLAGPSERETDSERYDGIATVTYHYDLELNADGRIMGGEWYQRAHPDMIWVNKEGQRPLARTEDPEMTGEWTSKRSAPPAVWRNAAPGASWKGEPLRKVVDKLLEWSAQ